MKTSRLLKLWNLMTSRALIPFVFGVFLLLYIMIAFRTEDALMALINVASANILLIALFALIPLNRVLTLIREMVDYSARKRVMRGHDNAARAELFDEAVIMPGDMRASETVGRRLVDSGYFTRVGTDSVAAWRGVTVFPARVLFLLAMFCLFSGVLISLGGRVSERATVIEGEPLPDPNGGVPGGIVQRIALEKSAGPFLGKTVDIVVAPVANGDVKKTFGLYPPSRFRSSFVYPRYLGVGIHYRLLIPDLPGGYESRPVLSIHPPGKEESRNIEGAPYRIVFSIAQPADGSDPYTTGLFTIQFKLLKGDVLLISGSAPAGGIFENDGYRLEFPEIRRVVIVDYIRDGGVYLIWLSALLFAISICIWLVVRTIFPRREMLFVFTGEKIFTFSRSEGRSRNHDGLFHDMLDSLSGRDK